METAKVTFKAFDTYTLNGKPHKGAPCFLNIDATEAAGRLADMAKKFGKPAIRHNTKFAAAFRFTLKTGNLIDVEINGISVNGLRNAYRQNQKGVDAETQIMLDEEAANR